MPTVLLLVLGLSWWSAHNLVHSFEIRISSRHSQARLHATESLLIVASGFVCCRLRVRAVQIRASKSSARCAFVLAELAISGVRFGLELAISDLSWRAIRT